MEEPTIGSAGEHHVPSRRLPRIDRVLMALVTAQTATDRLADHVVDLSYDDIPSHVVQHLKELLVHHLGLALRVPRSDRAEAAVALAVELSGSGGNSSIIGDRRGADLLEAVFANSFLIGRDGMDDYAFPGGIHPGVVTQPVALAVGESTRASGRELIAALVAGYDVIGKLANTVWTWSREQPRRPNNIFAPLGAAATAARLFGLSREDTGRALGHAAHAGMGLIEGGGESQRPYHPLLARNGLMAAILAKAKMAMVPTTIEGRHGLFRSYFGEIPEPLQNSLDELGVDFEISKARTKRYVSSAFNIVPIELMTELVQTQGVSPHRVAGIEVALPIEREERETVMEAALAKSNASPIRRASSLRFQLGIVVADGGRNPARFTAPLDADIENLLAKIELSFEPNRPLRYARLEVTTTDGERYVIEGDDYDFPPVDWAQWLSQSDQGLLSERQVAQLVDLIGTLEEVPDVGAVMALLVPEGSSHSVH